MTSAKCVEERVAREGKRFVNLRFIPMVREAGIELEEVQLSLTGSANAGPAWLEQALRLWENYEDCRPGLGGWRRIVMQHALKTLHGMGECQRLEALAAALSAQALTAGDEGEVFRPIESLSGLSDNDIERLFMGHYYGKAK